MDSWQDVLGEEMEKRNTDWNPIRDTSYGDISVEDRVRKMPHHFCIILLSLFCQKQTSLLPS
jgi:hypothetical protein